MSSLYDCSRSKYGNKSPLSIGLAILSMLMCLLFTPNLDGHPAGAAVPAPPNAPSNLTATAVSNSSIDLAWTDNSTNEDGFIIEIKVDAAGDYTELDAVGANVQNYSSNGLDAGTQYFYRVRAFNAEGQSGFSNEADASTLPDPPFTPSSLTATASSNTQINLTWTDNSTNEEGFKIERKLSSAVIYTQIATVSANVTSFSNIGLTTNTAYSYRVRAYNTSGNSGYSNVASAMTLPNAPNAPGNLKATTVSNTTINLTWMDNSNNEDGFTIERRLNTAVTYTEIATVGVNSTSFSSTGLTPNTAYSYRVRAINGGGASAYSNVSSATTFSNPPPAPSNLSAMAISNNEIDLGWQDNSTNELGFIIERKAGAFGAYAVIDTVDANVTNFVSLGLIGSVQYFYRVRAFNVTGNSVYSNEANAVTQPDPPVAPSNLVATAVSNKRIDLSWTDNSRDEIGFIIERKVGSGGAYVVIDTINTSDVTTFSDVNLTGSTQYFYRVRAYNDGGTSDYTNEANAITRPDAPTAPIGLTATAASNHQINLSWSDKSSNEDGFKIEIKTGTSGTYSEIDVVNANVTSYASTGLKPGTSYFYRVRAYNIGGVSAYSNEANGITLSDPPLAPSSLTATTFNNTQIDLAWKDNSNSEDGFIIEQRLSSAVMFTQIATVGPNVTVYSSTSLSPNTGYTYRVRAYNASGNSPYSNLANATTLPNAPAAPTNLTATMENDRQINLAWTDNATNEVGFIIERKTGPSGVYAVIDTVNANVTSFANTDFEGGTQYFYTVRAYNTGGRSAASNVANVTTLLEAPSNLAVKPGKMMMTLDWSDNAKTETGFKIERKQDTAVNFTEITTVGANVVTYADTGLGVSTKYTYRIRAYNSRGYSAYSTAVEGTTLPNPPAGLTATTVSNKRINLAWKDSSNSGTGFKIERKKGATGVYAEIKSVGANVKSYADSSLVENTLYFYRVRAFNAGGNSAYSNEANATTLPNAPRAPLALTATPVSQTRINLAWKDSSNNETGFKIERKLSTAATFTQIAALGANVTSYADTGLTVNTQYSYRLRAYNTGGSSPYSNTVEVATLPTPPAAPATLTAATVSSSEIKLAWQDKSGNETGFKIERKLGNAGTFTQIATVGVNVTSFASTGLVANSKYFYRVRAYNAGGNSAYSNTVNATTLPKPPVAPSNLTATPVSYTRINLAWQDKSVNEDSFKIERKLGAAGTYAQIARVAANVTSFADTSLNGSTPYFYRVRASNKGGTSAYSNEANATTLPSPPNAPSSLAATTVNQTRINLAWTDNANNEAGFRIERKTGVAGTFAEIVTLGANVTSYADTGLTAGSTYFYRVRTHNVSGSSAYSNEANATTLPNPPAAPSNLTAAAVSNLQINLTWQDKSANEDSFKIERKLGLAGTYKQIARVGAKATSYSDSSGLTAVTDYFYRIRASNAGGQSGYSNEATAKTLPNPPAAPSNLTATTISQTQINLAWTDNSNDETGFTVERKTADGTYVEIVTLGANVKNFSDTGLIQGTQYFYRVRANNTGGHSGYSEANATTLPTAPKAPVNLTATTLSNKKINLAWADSSNNESSFKIERKTGAAGTFAQIATLDANVKSYVDSSLAAGTQYFYRVRASNLGGNSVYSKEANATTLPNPPKKPGNLIATPVSNKRINLTWADSSNNESGFRIERKTGSAGTFAQIAAIGANVKSYADSSLTPITAYFYRVRAFNAGGNSNYSNIANATTLPNPPKAPVKLTATAVSKSKINLAWADSSNNESGFRIERKTGAAGTYAQVASVGANVKSYADSSLAGGTVYFYRVRAFNAGGNSGYSNEANAKTLPTAPAAPDSLIATVAGGNQVNLAWADKSNNEDSFKIEAKTTSEGTYAQIGTVDANVKSFSHTGLTEGVTYFYRVRAFNAGGNSAYSNEASATPSSGTNLAVNKPVVASSTDSTSAASNGVDGNLLTLWRSGFVNASNALVTYQVQLHPSLPITIGKVVLRWFQNYFPNEYEIQVSNDASNWTTIHTNAFVTTSVQEVTITATPTKYVRIYMKKNNKSNYRISELEIYGAVTKAASATAANDVVIPETIMLQQNYPNPFNPSTTISYALPEGVHVSLKVINVAGQEVATLVDDYQDRGLHRVTFNARKLPSGVYYAVMKAGEVTQTKRMVLAK